MADDLPRRIPFGRLYGMKARLKVDKAGRIVLPKQLRRLFRLQPGDPLDLEVLPEGILLRSGAPHAGLSEESGLLVHDGELEGDLLGLVELSRGERDQEVR